MPPPATRIFSLSPHDADRYSALRREMLTDSPWAFGSSPDEDRGVNPATVRELLAGTGYAIFAAETIEPSPRLVAAAGLLREARAKRRHIATIWGVYVAPAWRKHGLGRAVVTEAVRAARGWEGLRCVQLCVSDSVPPPAKSDARRLYESLGFTAWGVEPHALRVDSRSYDETHMSLAL